MADGNSFVSNSPSRNSPQKNKTTQVPEDDARESLINIPLQQFPNISFNKIFVQQTITLTLTSFKIINKTSYKNYF